MNQIHETFHLTFLKIFLVKNNPLLDKNYLIDIDKNRSELLLNYCKFLL
jgi:hypothetical protein